MSFDSYTIIGDNEIEYDEQGYATKLRDIITIERDSDDLILSVRINGVYQGISPLIAVSGESKDA